MRTGILPVFAGVLADVDRETSSLMEHEGDAQRPNQQTRSPVYANKVHRTNKRRRSNLPQVAVSLPEWRTQTCTSGIDSAPPGTARKLVTVVFRGGSEAEQCQSAALK